MKIKCAVRKLIISPIITLDMTPDTRTLIIKEIINFEFEENKWNDGFSLFVKKKRKRERNNRLGKRTSVLSQGIVFGAHLHLNILLEEKRSSYPTSVMSESSMNTEKSDYVCV